MDSETKSSDSGALAPEISGSEVARTEGAASDVSEADKKGAATAAVLEEDSGNPETDQLFRTDHLRTNLASRTLRAGIITLSTQGTKFVLNLASTAILARLLKPAEFGIVAMAGPIVGIIAMFKDLGLSEATIQKDKITHEQVSMLFWLNIAISVFLALVTAAISPAVAWFYGDARPMWVVMVSGGLFIVSALNAQHSALLIRQMRFGTSALIELSSMTFGLLAGVIAALNGWSYWSLVAQSVVGSFVSLVAMWTISPWRPGRPRRGTGVRSMLAVGGGWTGYNILAFFCWNVDRALIGRYWGAEILGMYSRGLAVFATTVTQVTIPITQVLVPALSRVATERERFQNVATNIVNVVAAALVPLAIGLLLCSDLAVKLLLGPQWIPAIPIVQIFSTLAFTVPISTCLNAILLAKGTTKALPLWGAIALTYSVAATLIGLPYGAYGVALAMSAATLVIGVPVHFYITFRAAELQFSSFRKILFVNLSSAILCGGVGYGIRQLASGLPSWPTLVLTLLGIGLTHLLILWRTGIIRSIWQFVVVSRRKAASPAAATSPQQAST